MKYRRLGRTGLKVSDLCLGTMQFGWTADEATSFQILDRAFELGFNFVDTADIYSRWADGNPGGVSEEVIGKWLDRGSVPREDVILATKMRGVMGEGPNAEGLSRDRIFKCIDASLRRLRTDYVDLYQLHWPDEETPLDETMEALNDLVRSGKVRYIGCSNYPAWLTMKAMWISDTRGFARFETTQPHYNLLQRDGVERELTATCEDQGIGILAWSPLAGGFLTGKYRKDDPLPESSRAEGIQKRYWNDRSWSTLEVMDAVSKETGAPLPQIALSWLLTRPAMTAAIIGANTVQQLEQIAPASDLELPEPAVERLAEVTEWRAQ